MHLHLLILALLLWNNPAAPPACADVTAPLLPAPAPAAPHPTGHGPYVWLEGDTLEVWSETNGRAGLQRVGCVDGAGYVPADGRAAAVGLPRVRCVPLTDVCVQL